MKEWNQTFRIQTQSMPVLYFVHKKLGTEKPEVVAIKLLHRVQINVNLDRNGFSNSHDRYSLTVSFRETA